MQKDEEVGKVAQATPIVICLYSAHPLSLTLPHSSPAKALELFLAMIIHESSKITLERGSKRVEAYHLCVASSVSVLPPLLPPSHM